MYVEPHLVLVFLLAHLDLGLFGLPRLEHLRQRRLGRDGGQEQRKNDGLPMMTLSQSSNLAAGIVVKVLPSVPLASWGGKPVP